MKFCGRGGRGPEKSRFLLEVIYERLSKVDSIYLVLNLIKKFFLRSFKYEN